MQNDEKPSQKTKKLGRKKSFLIDHPMCCFCGGAEAATTLDHVPPKACFPDGHWPEGFEFPACEPCNQESKREDQVVGFYTHLLDFSESNRTPAADAKLMKLRDALMRNYPNALPDLSTARAVHRAGSIITTTPVAISVKSSVVMHRAFATLQRKLTHALYYRETGNPLTRAHVFQSGYNQIQGTDITLTEYFRNMLPTQTIGGRTNIPKNYGERFMYKHGSKEDEDFFVYAAQFGRGLIVWGIAMGSGLGHQAQHLGRTQWAGRREATFLESVAGNAESAES